MNTAHERGLMEDHSIFTYDESAFCNTLPRALVSQRAPRDAAHHLRSAALHVTARTLYDDYAEKAVRCVFGKTSVRRGRMNGDVMMSIITRVPMEVFALTVMDMMLSMMSDVPKQASDWKAGLYSLALTSPLGRACKPVVHPVGRLGAPLSDLSYTLPCAVTSPCAPKVAAHPLRSATHRAAATNW